MNEKTEAPEIKSDSKLLKWLDNFWYHYKWHTLIIGFFLLTLIVCLSQCTRRENKDVGVTIACNLTLTESESKALETALGEAVGEDYDKNGLKQATALLYSIFNEEQLKAIYTEVDPVTGETSFDNSGYQVAKQHNAERIENLQTYIMTGDCAVWFVSPYVYETMMRDKLPVVKTVQLGQTDFYRYYDALKVLPEDTVMVLIRPVMGYMAKDENYRKAEAFVNAIESFKMP
jgi:hypothetical protein